MHRLIRIQHERCTRIGIRIDGDRLDAHATSGLDDTTGNFAPVCDQDFFEHALNFPNPFGLSLSKPCPS